MIPVLFLAIGTLIGAAVGQGGASIDAPGTPIARTVFALTTTKQDDRNAPRTDLVHALLQTPLNHLGMVVRIHDLREGEPAPESLDGVRAVVTWFRPGDRGPDWLWPWLEAAADRGLRVVHFGDLGPLREPIGDRTEPERLRRWLARFGLGFDANVVTDPMRIDVDLGDPALSAYESTPLYTRVHGGPRNLSADNHVWVTTRDRERPEDTRTPVVTGAWGGLALDPWAVRVGGAHGDRRWYVDPFAFFARALGLDRVPAPDPNVLNGRRMFFFHVDGDGFESVSTVRRGQLAARVMLDEVIDRYALPMTISIVVASLTGDLRPQQSTPEMDLAQRILNRDHVEPASHSVLHPLNWRRRLSARSAPRTVVWYDRLDNYRHDMLAEVGESLRFIDDHLLEPPRRCRVMLWSGVANPTEEVLREVERLGCWNLNGGVFRWDDRTDSVGFVEPWGKQVGAAFQVYCGAANENIFDGFFTTMPGAFGHIDRTLENTGRGRILKPADVYAHFYSAERPGRLAALRRLIERWGMSEETAPVFASTYARAVWSAQHACRVLRIEDGWALRDFGDCRTVRIDGEERAVDWRRSRGLAGARRLNGALFVHLAAPDADLVLDANALPAPHVEQADHALAEVVLTSTAVALRSTSFARRSIVFAGFPAEVAVHLAIDDVAQAVHSDAAGRVTWSAPPGTARVQVRIQ